MRGSSRQTIARRKIRRRSATVALLVLLAACTGCTQGPGGIFRFGLAPTVDRLVRAYPDLESRRFLVLADFENPVQGTLFRTEPAGTPGSAAVSTDRAQLKTGVGSLKVALASAGQRLICTASPDSKWGFPRDWSKYHLLLVSVYSPRQIAGFEIAGRSGTNLQLRYDNPPVPLRQGWNLLRLDLGDFGDRIDLADVRALEFAFASLDAPIEIYLDDLILADNARDILKPAADQPGDLYLRGAGRRLIVGAVDRFELTFSRGHIRQWYDLAFDKTRIHNLAGVESLGPNPVLTTPGESPETPSVDASAWPGAGTTVETRQSLISLTPLQVVIQGEWRFTASNSEPSQNDPCHRWVYSIYSDGRVYVECSGTAIGQANERGQITMTFCCDAGAGFSATQVASAPAAEVRDLGRRDPFALFSRAGRGQADLLVVPARPLESFAGPTPSALTSCTGWNIPVTDGQFAFAAMVRVWPSDIDSPDLAAPFAADYCHPLPLQLDAGQLVRTDPGDLDNDGFSEGRGYYVLQLSGSIAKVRIGGPQYLRFSPLFKVVDVTHRDVWVYVDGRQIKDLVRDEDDNAIFMVPDVISREALVEITSRPREADAKPAPR